MKSILIRILIKKYMKFKLILLTFFYIPHLLISIPVEQKEILRLTVISGGEGFVPFVGSLMCQVRSDGWNSSMPEVNFAAHSAGLFIGAQYVRRHLRCNRAMTAMLFASNMSCLALKVGDLLQSRP
ncbi:hypothetical protein A3F06_00305 [candidate division TM6 bacterium RIFCSPHIGHO2_12_FULL_36_22]|nr:MAG: hypothetical protein A3F06_00305 [candidate division TM6 bacterium RIFCSPHIGHO2_12_FULL_36_22]